MTTVSLERTFEETEKRGELFASLARVVIAIVILFAAWVSRGAGAAGQSINHDCDTLYDHEPNRCLTCIR